MVKKILRRIAEIIKAIIKFFRNKNVQRDIIKLLVIAMAFGIMRLIAFITPFLTAATLNAARYITLLDIRLIESAIYQMLMFVSVVSGILVMFYNTSKNDQKQ